MVLAFQKGEWGKHRGWFWFAVLIALSAFGWCAYRAAVEKSWPRSSSQTGIALGVFAAGLILFEAGIYVRKLPVFRNLRLGSARSWMIAHIWLGLLTVPITLLHCQIKLGGLATTFLMIVFFGVILSGIHGFVLQQVLPSRMLVNIRTETIASQIDRVVRFLRRDAERLMASTHGTIQEEAVSTVTDDERERLELSRQYLVVGKVRSAGRIEGKTLEVLTAPPILSPADHQIIKQFFDRHIEPFFREDMGRSRLADPLKASSDFDRLRSAVAPEAVVIVDGLQALCDERRDYGRQARYHFWLHNWLHYVHIPLTVSLLVLLAYHIWTAFVWW